MAVYEHKPTMTYVDEIGDEHRIFPKTKKDCVDGMEDIDEHLLDTNNPHEVTAEQVKLTDGTTVEDAIGTALNTANSAASKANQAATAAQNAQESANAALEAVTDLVNTISAVPTQNGTLTFTGSEQSPSWNNYNPETLTLGGVTTGTNAGTYTATFTPKEGYKWSDDTTTAKEVTWTINRATISGIPTQNGSLTYTGEAQTPTWNNYNTAQLTIGGEQSATAARQPHRHLHPDEQLPLVGRDDRGQVGGVDHRTGLHLRNSVPDRQPDLHRPGAEPLLDGV